MGEGRGPRLRKADGGQGLGLQGDPGALEGPTLCQTITSSTIQFSVSASPCIRVAVLGHYV